MPSFALNDASKKAEISCQLLDIPRYLDQPVIYSDTVERRSVFTKGKQSSAIAPAQKRHNSLIKATEFCLKGEKRLDL